MSTRTLFTAGTIALLMLIHAGHGQDQATTPDAYFLRENLRDKNGTFLSGVAAGYIAGVEDTLDGVKFCVPLAVRNGEIRDVVMKFLNDHPERLHQTRMTVTVDALASAFPCPLIVSPEELDKPKIISKEPTPLPK